MAARHVPLLFVIGWCLTVSALAAAGQAPGPPNSFVGANYSEAKVPPYTLPDPLVCFDGTRVPDVRTWIIRRRPEVLRTFETEVYGRVPAIAAKPAFRVTTVDPGALGGLATRKLVTVHLLGREDGPTMDLLLYVPNAPRRPVPAFLGLNFAGNQSISADPGVPVTTRWVRSVYLGGKSNRATEASRAAQAGRWPVETILARGYAVATVFSGDLEPDHPAGWRDGIRGATKPAGEGDTFAPDAWGATAAWAWGLSRALDYLATDADIDGARVAVHGHSRLGKAALWAGASDERFALVISNNSGEGGASLMRRDFGETIAQANANEPHRFCGNFRRYNDRPEGLPVDAHLLIALMAPRPVYVASASEDLLADPRGEFLAAKNAGPVYRLFGRTGLGAVEQAMPDQPIGDCIGYHLRTGKHDITAYDWEQYLAFADRQLRRTGNR